MIRHPSEHFVKYLMVCKHAGSLDDKWVASTIMSFGYPQPDQDYILWLRASLNSRMPSNFQPNNRYNRESVRFMRSEGIYSLFNPDKASREAHQILKEFRARPFIENMLLSRMEPKDIAKKINARLGEFFTGEGIEAYAHYYWNTKLLTVEDWSKLLEEHESMKQNTLAILQVGPALALHKLGFQQAIDSKTILRDMMEGLYFDFREWKTKDHGINRTKAMATLSRSAVMVDVQLSQADSAMKDSLKAFEQFRMKHAQGTVKDMRALAPGGNISGSGAKLIEEPMAEETEHE